MPPHPLLSQAEIFAVGEPYAAAIAASPDGARDAAELVEIDAEMLEASVEPDPSRVAWRFDFSLLGRLTLVHYRDAQQWLPGTLLPPLSGIAAVAFRTPDLAAQRARLTAAGIAVREANGRLLVPAEEACGVAVLFEA